MLRHRLVALSRQPRRLLVGNQRWSTASARLESRSAAEAHEPSCAEGSAAEQRLAVKAVYVARSIDVVELYERSSREGVLKQQRFGRESIMLTFDEAQWQYYDLDVENDYRRLLGPSRGHVVVFSYGSVVFFNVDAAKQADCLTNFAPFCAEAIPDGFRPTEDYCVVARDERCVGGESSDDTRRLAVTHRPPRVVGSQYPAAATLSRAAATRREPTTTLSSSLASSKRTRARQNVGGEGTENPDDVAEIRFDAVVLPGLDVHNLSVIATVMAQSVALDHYSVKVDAMLETFTRLNSSVEKTGVFSALEKQALFRLVALNNTLFTEIISKIGLLERSETAWKDVEYTRIWEGLREEFEVEDRFEKIEFKLNLVQLNTKFFLEILANQKSNTLEWIIIVLITLEILVSCADICGVRPFG